MLLPNFQEGRLYNYVLPYLIINIKDIQIDFIIIINLFIFKRIIQTFQSFTCLLNI
jgi:hypothetical protein